MTVKHTPGPWHIDQSDDVDLRNHVGISAKAHGLLAQVVWKMEDDDRTPHCEANAHLIAAAPEMLVALQACIDYGSTTGDEWVLKKARAAIAKATGINSEPSCLPLGQDQAAA